jgi:pimeloyl-ACP methyl ester carboxylesterase
LSSKGHLEVIPDSGHWIMLDRPDVVIRAIEHVMDAG